MGIGEPPVPYRVGNIFKKKKEEALETLQPTQQTLARMVYLENHTSVLLGVFFIVTGVKN